VTLDAAKASGLMESVEFYHAERISAPVRFARYAEMQYRFRMADVATLAREEGSEFDVNVRALWIESRDLLSGESVWLPLELMSLDVTRPSLPGGGCFVTSSSGLASGNTWSEAVTHGVCEVLERDAFLRFEAAEPEHRERSRVRLATVDDADCVAILERFDRAGVSVAVWDTTGPSGIASFTCSIIDQEDRPHQAASGVQHGMGCHPDRGVALSRALTEAAQCRLTLISGARDDLWRAKFVRAADIERIARERANIERVTGVRTFGDVPTSGTDDLDADADLVVQRAATAGFFEVLLVDHSIPEFGLAVVHVVIPGSFSLAPKHHSHKIEPV
jgi:ribosomal protein S12 methylthiotransferase accessory factor